MTSLPAGVRDPSDRFEFLLSLSLTHTHSLSLSYSLSLSARPRTDRAGRSGDAGLAHSEHTQ